MTDRELLAECIRGNPRAQEAFVREYSDLIYRSVQYALKCRNATYTPQDVDDLHNTIFVKFFENRCSKLRQFKGKNGCSPATWIRLIAVRTVLDYLRKSRTDAITRQERLLPLEKAIHLSGETPKPWVAMEKKEQLKKIREAMKRMLPRDRLFLKLHCLEGLEIPEVARILKISETNAYSLKHRAIARLRQQVAGEGDAEGP